MFQDANVLGKVLRMNSFVEQIFFSDSVTYSTPYEGCTTGIDSNVTALTISGNTESLRFTEVIYDYDRRHDYGYALFV